MKAAMQPALYQMFAVLPQPANPSGVKAQLPQQDNALERDTAVQTRLG